MQDELQALIKTNTWLITFLPAGKISISCKWVYRIKFKADATVERYKARLVAKGFTQQARIDFHDTFSHVAKLTTVKMMLALAAIRCWILAHLDINNAFLYGDLEEEIYMVLPPGLVITDPLVGSGQLVCKLKKSLYGLKQASRQWYMKFSQVLSGFGLLQSAFDHSYFYKYSDDGNFFGVVIYVDDILVASSHEGMINQFKDFIAGHFKFKDLGTPKYFLGIEIARNDNGIFICQHKYALDLVTDVGLLGCKPASTPMDSTRSLAVDAGEPIADPTIYRRLIGRLVYLCITRPDIIFAVNKLSQFLSKPCFDHMAAGERVLKYLKGTIGHGLFYSAKSSLMRIGQLAPTLGDPSQASPCF